MPFFKTYLFTFSTGFGTVLLSLLIARVRYGILLNRLNLAKEKANYIAAEQRIIWIFLGAILSGATFLLSFPLCLLIPDEIDSQLLQQPRSVFSSSGLDSNINLSGGGGDNAVFSGSLLENARLLRFALLFAINGVAALRLAPHPKHTSMGFF